MIKFLLILCFENKGIDPINLFFGFDNIIVLDNGSIIEEGDSKTLTKNNGLFSELLKVQKILPKEKVRN